MRTAPSPSASVPQVVRPRVLLAVALSVLLLSGVATVAPLLRTRLAVVPSSMSVTSSYHLHPMPGRVAALAVGGLLACVRGDRDAAGENVVIGQDQQVCGSVTAIGGNVSVLGQVQGQVTAIGGTITVAGTVDGDVTALGGDVRLLSSAHITGTVRAVGGQVVREDGAVVTMSAPIAPPPMNRFPRTFALPILPGGIRLASLVETLLWLLVASVLAAVASRQLGRVGQVVRGHIGPCVLVGAVSFLVALGVGVILIVTVIGIPLALALVIGVWCAWLFGTVAIGTWVGGWLLTGLHLRRRPRPVLAAVLGILMVSALKSLPMVGGVLNIGISCAGLGGVLLALASQHGGWARR